MQIKARVAPAPSLGKILRRDVMPADTALMVSGVVIAFVIFMLALAWADFRTRHINRP
jgi:hypothetical protein